MSPASSICLDLTCHRVYSLVLNAEFKIELKDVADEVTAAKGPSFWSTVSASAELMERFDCWFPPSIACTSTQERYTSDVKGSGAATGVGDDVCMTRDCETTSISRRAVPRSPMVIDAGRRLPTSELVGNFVDLRDDGGQRDCRSEH